MNISISGAWIDSLGARTATGLAEEIAGLIGAGVITPGDQLPTIRSVATALNVSVGTVAEAWSTLRDRHLVETRRRGGTRVIAPPAPAPFSGWAHVDFLLSSPDTSLQPPLEGALVRGLRQPGVNAWGREHMVDALRRAVQPIWPFAAQDWTSAGGGTEGLWLATRAAVRDGRPVAVEEPAPPGFLGVLADMGVEVIGVAVDEDGPLPASLARARDAGIGAFILQPGGPFSDRAVLSADRAEELAVVLSGTDVAVVEDDSLGPLSAVPVLSLGALRPDHTIRVLSYCKAYGLDLRTSVVGGAKRLIDRAVSARSGGLASTSRILQHALAVMVADADAAATVDDAREHYARRRARALEAFADAGLVARSGAGSLVVWVEVPSEREAVMALATRGIVVEGGSSSFVSPPEQDLLRVSIAQLPEDPDLIAELADTFARAVQGDLRVRFD